MVAVGAGSDLSFLLPLGTRCPWSMRWGLQNCCVGGIKTVLGFGVSSGSLPRPHLGRGIQELVLDSITSDLCESCCTPAHHRAVLGDLPFQGEAQQVNTTRNGGDGSGHDRDTAQSHAISVIQRLP